MQNIYLSILKILLKQEEFKKHGQLTESLLADMPELVRIVLCLKDYYGSNQTDLGSVDNLELYFFGSYPSLRPKEQEAYSILFERLKATEVRSEFVDQYLKEIRTSQVASELAIKAMDLSSGKGDVSGLETLLNDLKQGLPLTTQVDFVTDDLDELLNKQFTTPGLRWRLNSLNKALGSLRKGDFGFVFKRPETGGTTFLASEVSFMAGQTDRPILWFNNEEQSEKVKIRCYQAALGCKLDSLYKNISTSILEYKELTGGNIRIFPDSSFSADDIERACSNYLPCLVVLDQIDKIRGFASKGKEDRKDLELGKLYQWVRELAKTYCPVIAVCQAAGSAENKMWLTMDDVAESKTSKQAEADFIIGIGKVHDESKKNLRYFNICKNKLLGDQDSMPELRHGRLTMIIKPELARYEDAEQF